MFIYKFAAFIFIWILCFMGIFTRVVKAQNACEVRGAWLNPNAFNTTARQDATLQKISKANLNTVFVAAPTIDSNYGWSKEPYFSQFIQKAWEQGISVHVWVSNMHRASQVDFTSATEQKIQADWNAALMKKYGQYLDGVHFDYIRYDKYVTATKTGTYAHLPRTDSIKTEGVNQTVLQSFNALKNSYSNKVLTAAVRAISGGSHLSGGPYPQDGSPYFWTKDLPYMREDQQDALKWLNEGYMDGVCRMNYTNADNDWNYEVDQWKAKTGSKFDRVYMGLGWYNDDGNILDAAGVIRKIKSGRSKGLKGFCIFQLGSLSVDDTPLVNALSINGADNGNDAPFKTKAVSCLKQSLSPTLTSIVSSGSCVKKAQGDANCDLLINGVDYSFWLNSQCRVNASQGCLSTDADFNKDGNIDDSDYRIWYTNR